jgi:hypothetical protein
MTDPTTAMLADVDARLRSAAGTLRAAVEEAIELPPSLPSARRRRPRGARGRVWLAAAVVVVVAGSAAVVLSGLAADDPDPTVRASGAGHAYLLPGWLPEGFEPAVAQRLDGERPTLGLTYGRSTSADGQISIVQAQGDEHDVGNLPLVVSGEPRPIVVRGHRAVRAEDDANTVIQWAERPGTLVTVVAAGVGDRELDRFVEALRPAGAGEIDDALRQYGQSSRLGELSEGEILVAEGEHAGGRWELVAGDDVERLGITLRDETGGTTVAGASGELDEGGYVSAVRGDTGATPAVFGLVGPGVAEVTAQDADAPPTRLVLLTIPGWQARAFLMWPAGDPSDVVLVFRDASGAEIGRSH